MDYMDGAGFCPNDCKVRTGFEEQHRQGVWPRLGAYDRSPDAIREHYVWTDVVTYMCTACRKTVVFTEQWLVTLSEEADELPEIRMNHRQMITPGLPPRDLHESIPDTIRSLYREASICEEANALRAAGVMYRAAVEELVKDQGAPEDAKLFHQIEHLKTTVLDEDLIRDLHEARILGNGSIHDGLAYSAAEVADVADLIEDATVTLYVQPAERRALRESREARRAAAKAKKNEPPTEA